MALKVGLITLSQPRERVDLAQSFHASAQEALERAGFQVCSHPDLVFDAPTSIRAAQACKEEGACCVFLLLGTWIDSPVVVDTLRAVRIPFAIWAEDNPASFSLTAGGIVHGSLDEFGLKHRFIYGSPSAPELMEEVSAYVRGAACSTGLEGQRLCVVGGRVPGMYTTMADIIQIKDRFGVETEHLDSLKVYLTAESLPAAEVEKAAAEIRSQFGAITVEAPVLDRSVRLYLALKQILTERGYKMAAVKCMDEMINHYCRFCLAVSLLNDDGFTVSCEGDIYGAITMEVLRILSAGAALFGDVNHLDHANSILRIVNCGSMASSLAESRKDVDLAGQYEYISDAGGAVTTFSVRSGLATAARLFRIKGSLGMVVFEGEMERRPKEVFKEARGVWPHAFMKLHCDSRALVQHLRSNHMHAGFGHHLAALREFCQLTDVEVMVP